MRNVVIVPSDTFDSEYRFGQPASMLSLRERARLDIYRSKLNARIPNGLPYMVEFEDPYAS